MFAVRRCPFLSQLAREHGEEYATSIALAPTKPVGAEPLPSGTDAVVALSSNFRLFHGPEGVVPLASKCPHLRSSSGSRPGCPHAAQQAAGGPLLEGNSSTVAAREPAPTRAVTPFATISLSGVSAPNSTVSCVSWAALSGRVGVCAAHLSSVSDLYVLLCAAAQLWGLLGQALQQGQQQHQQ